MLGRCRFTGRRAVRRLLLHGRRVPDTNVPVVTGGDDLPAVYAEGDAGDVVGVAADGEDFLAGPGVPELDGLVGPAAGDDALSIGAEGHAPGRPCVALQNGHLLARRHV